MEVNPSIVIGATCILLLLIIVFCICLRTTYGKKLKNRLWGRLLMFRERRNLYFTLPPNGADYIVDVDIFTNSSDYEKYFAVMKAQEDELLSQETPRELTATVSSFIQQNEGKPLPQESPTIVSSLIQQNGINQKRNALLKPKPWRRKRINTMRVEKGAKTPEIEYTPGINQKRNALLKPKPWRRKRINTMRVEKGAKTPEIEYTPDNDRPPIPPPKTRRQELNSTTNKLLKDGDSVVSSTSTLVDPDSIKDEIVPPLPKKRRFPNESGITENSRSTTPTELKPPRPPPKASRQQDCSSVKDLPKLGGSRASSLNEREVPLSEPVQEPTPEPQPDKPPPLPPKSRNIRKRIRSTYVRSPRRRKRKVQRVTWDPLDLPVSETLYMEYIDVYKNAVDQFADKFMFFDFSQIEYVMKIGRGSFGEVFRAILHTDYREPMIVAAKTIYRVSGMYDRKETCYKDFLNEAVIMKDLDHPNVLGLIGISFDDKDAPVIITPFMASGDLRRYLKKNEQSLELVDLLDFALQIAEGMNYLSRILVHRDLAARNCMISKHQTYTCVKVADFGMSRSLIDKDYYRMNITAKSKLPFKWMALETFETGQFSAATDVWSFGVVLWELLTYGAYPYPLIDNSRIHQFLKKNQRMSKPRGCPNSLYKLMMKCWDKNPEKRPPFSRILGKLRIIMGDSQKSRKISFLDISQRRRGNSCSL